MYSEALLAAGNWGIEYNYDQPYENHTLPRKYSQNPPVYLARYRASVMQRVWGEAGVRFNIQQDNYIYGLNPNRHNEFSAQMLDTGLFYTFEDNLLEIGKTDASSPIWKNSKLSEEQKEMAYFRFGKNRFLRDRMDLMFKFSADTNNSKSLEFKLIDKSKSNKPELKIRFDHVVYPGEFKKKAEDFLSTTIVFYF
jgi:hypothetical protein